MKYVPADTGYSGSVEDLSKRMLWLAYRASRVVGMGFIPALEAGDMTEDKLWEAYHTPGEVSVDYGFGRMMKLGFHYDTEIIEADDRVQCPDYQSWASTYPTYKDLIEAAIKSLNEGEAPADSETANDPFRAIAVMTGQVPAGCDLPGAIIAFELDRGVDPCAGCNTDRAQCKGRPKNTDAYRS